MHDFPPERSRNKPPARELPGGIELWRKFGRRGKRGGKKHTGGSGCWDETWVATKLRDYQRAKVPVRWEERSSKPGWKGGKPRKRRKPRIKVCA